MTETPSNTIFTIKDALASLKDANYIGYLQDTCDNIRVNTEKPFVDLIETIVNDPMQWFMAFPMRLKSASALSKPKTAILNILSHNATKQALGEEICSTHYKAIEKTWKEHKNELIASRTAGNSADNESHVSAEGVEEHNHLDYYANPMVSQEEHDELVTTYHKIIKEEKQAKQVYMERAEKLEQQLEAMESNLAQADKLAQERIKVLHGNNKKLKDMIMILIKHIYPEPDNVNHILYSNLLENW